jgi:hypothetical protein
LHSLSSRDANCHADHYMPVWECVSKISAIKKKNTGLRA